MENILRPALLRLENIAGTQHPSAETLAAFCERALSARDREAVLAHLSECAQCREWLSAIACSAVSQDHRAAFWCAASGIAASICALTLLMHSSFWNAPLPPRPPIVHWAPLPQDSLTALAEIQVGGQTLPRRQTPKRPPILWGIQGGANIPVLQKSRDGGKSWQPVVVTPAFHVHSVTWSGSTAWVSSDRGEVLQSRDGGGHWEPLAFPAQNQLGDAVARATSSNSNSRLGYAVVGGSSH